jgi:benzylsuccinate CoA-transferase BbsF subunit
VNSQAATASASSSLSEPPDVPDMPFAGLRVVDFAWVGVGPIVSRHLADFGATVIRVESATRPDTLRLAPPFRDGQPGLDRSAFGAVYNTNKWGLALNLRLPAAREIALRLVAWADVVTESMTPGSLAKLGLSYEDLRRVKPDIVMYSTTQQGQTGPYRSFGGYGQHGAATAGLHALTGWPDRQPAGVFGAYTDFIAPWFLIAALIAAIDHRDRTGEGQHLDQAQVEAGMQLLGPQLLDYFANGHAAERAGNDDSQMFPHGAFPCADSPAERPTAERGPGGSAPEGVADRGSGQSPERASQTSNAASQTLDDRWLAIAVRDETDWQALSRALGRDEWADDPALATVESRRARRDEIDRAISAWTATRTPHEAMAALQAAGVPAGAVQTCEELFDDPQLLHRGHWWHLQHTAIGLHAYDAPAWKLSSTPAQPRRAGPALGQHTYTVCHEILGLDDAEIARLSAEGVFE